MSKYGIILMKNHDDRVIQGIDLNHLSKEEVDILIHRLKNPLNRL